MASRAAWILAGGVALIGGMIYHDRIGFSMGDEPGSAIIVDARGERSEVDPATARALAAAVGRLVKAETKLATIDVGRDPSPAELAAARTERDRADAEVKRLEAAIEAQRAGPDKHRTRDEVRTQVREVVR